MFKNPKKWLFCAKIGDFEVLPDPILTSILLSKIERLLFKNSPEIELVLPKPGSDFAKNGGFDSKLGEKKGILGLDLAKPWQF